MTTCPNCGGERVHRVEARIPGGWAGYNSCWDCWHCWDGFTEPLGLTLPVGVIARGLDAMEEASDD